MFILHWVINMTLANDVKICEVLEGTYKCSRPTHAFIKKLDVPPNSCVHHDCSLCVTGFRSYIIIEDYELIPATSFLSRPSKRFGSQDFFACTANREPCDCSEKCAGTEDVCKRIHCTPTAPCFCRSANTTYEVVHIHQDRRDINPPVLSLRTCLFKKPLAPHKKRSRRRLLEHEEASFTSSNLTISFNDPIITVPGKGRLIVRSSNYEHVYVVKEDLQVVLPVEFLAYKQKLSCIFISEKGKAVYGEIAIQGKAICRTTECILCKEFFLQTKCWPTHLSYPFYALTLLVAVLILVFLKKALCGIWSLLKVCLLAIIMIGHLLRAVARLFLLCGALTGSKFRDGFDSMVRHLEENAPQRIPLTRGMFVLLACLCIISPGMSDCSTHSLISSEVQQCKTQDVEQTCQVTTTAQIILMGLDHEVCLWLQDKRGTNLYHLKIRLTSAQCEYQTQRQYFTFPVTTKSLSTLACPQNAQCGWGTHCTAGKEFIGLTEEAKSFPGFTHCLPSSVGSGCTIVSRMGCLFHRVYFVPDLLSSYEVRSVQGHVCTYTLAVEETANSTVQYITLSSSATTHKGIRIELVGSFNQPLVYIPESLVSRVGDPTESYLVDAAPLNHPTAGSIGQIQANTSFTKDFSFDPDIARCDFFETTLRCTTKTDFLKTTIESKERALPLARGFHLLEMEQDRLTSRLLSTAPVQVLLNFKNFNIVLQTQDICPKISSDVIITKGCYSCGILATMHVVAHSTCSHGVVTVEFQRLVLYTKSITLTTEPQPFIIQFHAEQKCYEEKLCLASRNMQTCKLLKFCLNEPSVNLLKLNTSYTKSFSKDEPSSMGIFEYFSLPTFSGILSFTKFIGAILLTICLSITIISTCMTCCRR